MSDVAIKVENLGKCYRLRHETGRPRYRTLRDDLIDGPRRLWRAMRTRRGRTQEAFWALKDVSFEVKRGEVLGIIGRNGAGKSTLLKIISRIVEPTTGAVDIYGRVGSLLEVGTGFHPELTGRENIFLSGAMLGMRRHEVRARLDEIVAFAEVEKFLDTPCKHYSSGMYTRLGFAVAAHLDAEILITDEVLAVGDAHFQQRCIEKLKKVSDAGRTVLFVSHNMSAIRSLCRQGIVLDAGQIGFRGPADKAADNYLASLVANGGIAIKNRIDRRGNGAARIEEIDIFSADIESAHLIMGRSTVFLFRLEKPITRFIFAIYDMDGKLLADFDSSMSDESGPKSTFPSMTVRCEVESLPLVPGRYAINAAAFIGAEVVDHIERAMYFEVVGDPIDGRTLYSGRGQVVLAHKWGNVSMRNPA